MCRELVSCADFKAILTPLEGGVTVSNNFTKRRQNSFKIGARDKFATHLRQENFISNEIVTLFTQFVFTCTISDFSYNSLYIHTPRILNLWMWCDLPSLNVM